MPAKIPFPIRVENHGRKVWQLSVPKSLSGGKRKRLFFETKEDAEAKRNEFVGELDGSIRLWAKLSPSEQAAVARSLARLNSDTDQLEQAVDLYLKKSVKQRVTAADAISECLASKGSSNKSAAYQATFAVSMAHLGRVVGEKLCSDVMPADIEAVLRQKSWAVETRRGILKDARTLFNFAMRRNYTNFNPANAVEMPERDNVAPGVLTVDECARYLAACLIHDRAMIRQTALCLFGGLRPSEALRIDDRCLLPTEIDVPQTKVRSRRHRFITLNPTLKAWLDIGTEWKPINGRKRREALRKLAGVPWPPDCLRHSFASYHLAQFKDATKTAHEMGHHSLQMLYDNYRNRVRAEEAERFWDLTPEAVIRSELIRKLKNR